uniref:Uncharacterized protein n=1 Tax=Arsenophonus nasoniae TaxID=638 RepID=D2TZS5_9GAMM|nr:hypothetical protein ARN_17050 [Arsenophonus nasoniae]
MLKKTKCLFLKNSKAIKIDYKLIKNYFKISCKLFFMENEFYIYVKNIFKICFLLFYKIYLDFVGDNQYVV